MINKYIDQTNLKPNATVTDIDQLIIETWTYQFQGICVAGCWVKYVAQHLNWIAQYGIQNYGDCPTWDFVNNEFENPMILKPQTQIQVIAVIGFPLGNESCVTKQQSALQAIQDGATEIDMVANIGMFLSHQETYVLNEINLVKQAIDQVDSTSPKVLKVILETSYLNDDQLIDFVKLINQSQAQYVKTNTGFGPRGVCYHDVQIICQYLQADKQLKVAGGIKTATDANHYVSMGASRIGTSSGVKIMKKE